MKLHLLRKYDERLIIVIKIDLLLRYQLWVIAINPLNYVHSDCWLWRRLYCVVSMIQLKLINCVIQISE